MTAYKVTTKKTPSQPGGLTHVFMLPGRKPTIAELHAWLKNEYGINSGAGESGFIIEKC